MRNQYVDPEVFGLFRGNYILIVDSSRIIRPQGHLVAEQMKMLPSLKKGVLADVHDIFTPKDYSVRWILHEVKFWDEQYLLKAFLSLNNQYRVLRALNDLKYRKSEQLAANYSVLAREMDARDPG